MRHEIIDRRSLTYARIAVWLIDHDPEKKGLAEAKKFLETKSRCCCEKWEALLALPWKVLRMKLREQTDEMQFLRQSTPFFIPEEIRRRIVNKYLVRNGFAPITSWEVNFPPYPSGIVKESPLIGVRYVRRKKLKQ